MKVNINGYSIEGTVDEIKELIANQETNNIEDDETKVCLEKVWLEKEVLKQIDIAYENMFPEAEITREIKNTIYSDEETFDEVEITMVLEYTEKREDE